MKKMTKGLLLVLCAAVLVAGSVVGTLAWLTAKSETITNTFVIGNISITLSETTGDTYKLVPGMPVAKDPTVTVKAGSEDCYLFVKVVNGIAAIEDSEKSIASQMEEKGWKALTGVENVYYYDGLVAAGATDQVYPLFENYTVSSDVSDLSAYDGAKIVITAYAVQSGAVGEMNVINLTNAWNTNFGANP